MNEIEQLAEDWAAGVNGDDEAWQRFWDADMESQNLALTLLLVRARESQARRSDRTVMTCKDG